MNERGEGQVGESTLRIEFPATSTNQCLHSTPHTFTEVILVPLGSQRVLALDVGRSWDWNGRLVTSSALTRTHFADVGSQRSPCKLKCGQIIGLRNQEPGTHICRLYLIALRSIVARHEPVTLYIVVYRARAHDTG